MQMYTGTWLTTAIHRRLSRFFLREGGRLYTGYKWVEFDVGSQSRLRREGFYGFLQFSTLLKKTDIFKLQFDLELSVVS